MVITVVYYDTYVAPPAEKDQRFRQQIASTSPALRQHFASTSPANDQQIATQKNEEQENEELEIIMYASINLSFAVLFSGSFRTLL